MPVESAAPAPAAPSDGAPSEPAVPAQEPSAASPAKAPASEETIQDPELQAVPSEPAAAQGSSDQVIEDPELRALPKPDTSPAAPAEPNGHMRVTLHTRNGLDTYWDDPLQDVFESTNIVMFEAKVRRSERLSFEVGVRARYMFASRAHPTDEANAERYELDIAPTAAFADIKLSDGLHLRLGSLPVHLGRFDLLNPSDILSSYDLRSGAVTMPEASEIAQTAFRFDWDAASWLSFTAIGLPFYQGHLVRAVEGDYGLSRIRRVDADTIAYAVASRLFSDPNQAKSAVESTRNFVRDALSRNAQGQLTESVFAAFFPPRALTGPQAALRTVAHGPLGELGLTLGSALEHIPAMYFSQAFQDYLCASVASQLAADKPNTPRPACPVSLSQAQSELAAENHPIVLRADRFELISIDAATDLGPFQIGAELAYMFNRTLLSAPPKDDFAHVAAQPEHSDVAHAGLRLEWVHSDDLVLVVETSAERTLSPPSDPSRRYLYLTDQRWFFAALSFLTVTPFDIGLSVELGGGVLNGPSYVLAPRAEQKLADHLFAEVGAALLAGKHRASNDPRATLGGTYADTSQVYIGVRWLP